MEKPDKIFVAGHRGLVGSALVRRLEAEGFTNLLTRDRSQLDLTRKLLDVTKLRNLGWTPSIPLREGVVRTYDWFVKNCASPEMIFSR